MKFDYQGAYRGQTVLQRNGPMNYLNGYCRSADTSDEEDVLSNAKKFKCADEIIVGDNYWLSDDLYIDGEHTNFDNFHLSLDPCNDLCSIDWKHCKSCICQKSPEHRPWLSGPNEKKLKDSSIEVSFRDLCIKRSSVKFEPWNVIGKKDADGDNLLFVAIIALKTQLAKSLIDMTPVYDKLNVVNKMFQTALHLAALTGNYLVARRLLVAGATVDKRDYRLNTPLHIAVGKGFIKVAKELMTPVTYLETKQNTYEIPYQKIPQNLEIFNCDGLTCLHLAGRNHDRKMMDLLLSNEADLNARELKSGRTLLHYFSETDNMNMVKFLISKSKLILDKQTYCGLTAAEVAYSRRHFGIAYLLHSFGATDTTVSPFSSCSDSESDSEN